eukprot:jgi/Chlat1/6533/Chrsp45S06013
MRVQLLPPLLILLLACCSQSTAACTPYPGGLRTWSSVFGRNSYVGRSITIDRPVLLDLATVKVSGGITISKSGGLYFRDATTRLETNFIAVYGTLQAGTETCPLHNLIRIVLTRGAAAPYPAGGKSIGGNASPWVKLASTLNAGSRRLTTRSPIWGWKSGDKIVLPSTDYDYLQTEEVTITDLGVNWLEFSPPAKYSHFSDNEWGQEQRGEVALLTRNIIVEDGSPGSASGAHMIFLAGVRAVRVEAVEVIGGGDGNTIGKYPMHFHLAGRVPAGTYLRSNSIHHTNFRGITLHGVQNAVVSRNVIYQTLGHSMYFQDGTEFDNVIDGNLVIATLPKSSGFHMGTDLAASVSSYWITNPRNTITNNVAAASPNVCYWFQLRAGPDGMSMSIPAYNWVQPCKTAIKSFSGNECHSTRTGLFGDNANVDNLDYTPGINYPHATIVYPAFQPLPGVRNRIDKFSTWRTWNAAMWFRGYSFDITNAFISDTPEGVQFSGSGNPSLSGLNVVSGSRFLGISNNRGNPSTPSAGVQTWDAQQKSSRPTGLYDGPIRLEDNTFINFPWLKNANGVPSVPYAPFGPRWYNVFWMSVATTIINNKFINSPYPLYNPDSTGGDGGKTCNMFDQDGSVSGRPYSTLLPNLAFYKTNRCKQSQAYGLACPHRYTNFEFMSRSDSQIASLTLYRNNLDGGASWGATQLTLSGMRGGVWQSILSAGASYVAHLTHIPKTFQLLMTNAYYNEFVEVAVCYPPGTQVNSVYMGFGDYDSWGRDTATRRPLARRYSVNDVRVANGGAYFYDTNNNFILVRVRQTGSRPIPLYRDMNSSPCPKGGCNFVVIDANVPNGGNNVPDCSARAGALRSYNDAWVRK